MISRMKNPVTAVVVVASILGATLQEIASSYADKYKATEGELLVVCGKLEQGLDGLREINKHAISSFAECMIATATFFNTIATRLKHLPPSDASVEDPYDNLKLVHEDMKRDARALVTACESFRACCIKMQVDIRILKAFQTEITPSYVDEWIMSSRREKEQQNTLRKYLETSGHCSCLETPLLKNAKE